jgi:DNA-binding XRE family transcriptional regulator
VDGGEGDGPGLPGAPDIARDIADLLGIPHPPASPSRGPSALGAGHLILVAREPTGLSQRALAVGVGTSQSALARLETGNAIPRLRTLLRVADAAGFHLVLGLRRPGAPRPDPERLRVLGFDLVGTLHANPCGDPACADLPAP